MIRHILTMLWNEKKRFYGILLEQMLVFIILMLSVVSVSIAVKKYIEPGLLDTEEVINFGYMVNPSKIDQATIGKVSAQLNAVVEHLKQLSYVKAVSESFCMAPYLRDEVYYTHDSIKIDHKSYDCFIKGTDKNGFAVFKPTLEEGEWFSDEKTLPNGNRPAIISRQLCEKAGWTNPVGKTFKYNNYTFQVIGVLSGIKQAVFDKPILTVIVNCYNSSFMYRELCARLNPGHEERFAVDYYKEFTRLISHKEVQPHVLSLSHAKTETMLPTTSGIALQLIPTLFLFVFAFLGTLGLFWVYAEKRIQEFGLRIAIGSTGKQLVRLVVAQSIFITFAASLPGLVLAILIYDFTCVHSLALVSTLAIMLLFSAVSAWYPAYRVTRITPAEALHYE